MAGNILGGYGTSNQAMTVTLTSLGSGAGRVATAVSNTSNLFTDVLAFLKFKTGTVSGNKQLLIYGIGSADGGTTYTDNVGGTDAAVSTQPPSAPIVGGVGALASTTSYSAGPFSIRQAFGSVPEKWSLAAWNDGGGTFSVTATDHAMFYQGVYGSYT